MQEMNDQYDETGKSLTLCHGLVRRMVCLRAYSDERFRDTHSPWELSGTYRITCADGAELVIISRFADSLCYGEFGIMGDTTGELTDYDNAYDERVLAYFADMGANLRRDTAGECTLPSVEEAREILRRYDVPRRPLRYFSYIAAEKKRRLFECWKRSSLVVRTEEGWAVRN